MNDARMMIQGNLALKLEAPVISPSRGHRGFSVVEGTRGTRPIAERSIYAHSDAPAQSAPQAYSMRARALFAVAAIVAAALMICAFFTRTSAYAAIAQETSYQTVTVESGDTLWDIADEHPVSGLSTYETVKLIQAKNELSGSSLAPGQSISVPVSSISR